ncbi:MAG: YjbQ family protein [Promethearchaeota archaeon]
MNYARLYCPDFSCVFGPNFANPFLYDNIDSQIWPILEGFKFPQETIKLLELKSGEHPLFYRRKISIKQLLLELECGNFGAALIQALEILEDYGIPNELVLEVCSKDPSFFPIFSLNLMDEKQNSDALIAEIKDLINKSEKIKKGVSAIVLYPAYLDIDLFNELNQLKSKNKLSNLIEFMDKNKIPLKIDITDLHLPNYHPKNIDPIKLISLIKKIRSQNYTLPIIIAGIDPLLNAAVYAESLKWDKNVYLEINHRTIGGTSPNRYFHQLFSLPGFINNWWSKILFASATPTLEPSQMMRGLLESTENLNFTFKNLLRIWGFRNGWRIFPNLQISLEYNNKMKKIKEFQALIKPKYQQKNNSSNAKSDSANLTESARPLHLSYDISLQSFSITQIISIQSTIKSIFEKIKSKYNGFNNGYMVLKTNHTTSSLLMNEHEIGNYLQFHYLLAEKTTEVPDKYLHTVAADELRADFNYPDHLIASTFGQRSITYPIRNAELQMGSREHLYSIITFGPRAVKISADFFLYMD